MFASFGLFAPANGTVIGSLFLCALSVSAAIFLILEMYAPYDGLIAVSTPRCAPPLPSSDSRKKGRLEWWNVGTLE